MKALDRCHVFPKTASKRDNLILATEISQFYPAQLRNNFCKPPRVMCAGHLTSMVPGVAGTNPRLDKGMLSFLG